MAAVCRCGRAGLRALPDGAHIDGKAHQETERKGQRF